MRFSTISRVLHLCMIIAVLYQLLSSVWMMAPEPGKIVTMQMMFFTLHVWLFGWAAFLVGSVYAMIKYRDRDEWERFFPWFSADRRKAFFRAVRTEVPGMLRGKLPPAESKSALSGAVHGFGIMLLIAQGLTGAYVMLDLANYGERSLDIQLFYKFHELFGILAWTFLGGHIFVTLYHLALGHTRVLDIFRRVNIAWK